MSASQMPINASPEFEALVRTYSTVLHRFFQKRIAESFEIDDLVQEVFLRLARHGVVGIANVEGYLFEMAANVLRDRYRHRTSRHLDQQRQLNEDYPLDGAFSPERVLQGKETLNRMVGALKELPERTQTVFVLSRFEELRNSDVAARLGISVSAVEKHITKALAHLASRLKDIR